MDAAIGFLLVLIFLAMLAFVIGVLYRNRISVSKWLNCAYYAEDDRKLYLKRRIENCQKELETIESREAKTEE